MGPIRMTTQEARAYFEACGLAYDDVTEGDILALVMMLNQEIKRAAKSGECIKTMHMSRKIIMRKKSNGVITCCFLYANSHYFTQRECISFNANGFIGFCGWADDDNAAPIIKAFIRWCDCLSGGGVDD